MGKKLQKYFVERVPKRLPGLSSFVDDLLQEQTKYLLDNPLEINAVGKTEKSETFHFVAMK